MKKRTPEEIDAAIARAWAETRGRPNDQIDHEADLADHRARCRVAITLRDYVQRGALDLTHVALAEHRYRKELEQALRGPARVLEVLRASERAREGSIHHLTREEQADAMQWARAVERAIAAGRRGLADVAAAWFEVRLVPAPPDERAAAQRIQAARAPMLAAQAPQAARPAQLPLF